MITRRALSQLSAAGHHSRAQDAKSTLTKRWVTALVVVEVEVVVVVGVGIGVARPQQLRQSAP